MPSLALHSDFARLLLSVLVISLVVVIFRVLLKAVQRAGGDMVRRRTRFVWSRNTLMFVCFWLLGMIWGTKIAGFALSVAAVGAALLIVSKEFISNVLGWSVLMFSRAYTVGDFIEMGGLRGRVIDINVMGTTLAEMLDANQITGRTALIPNGVLLTQAVKNVTATGKYVVHLLRVATEPDDMLIAQRQLLEATQEVCQAWLAEADAHLARMERIELVDLPSSEPKVLVDLTQAKEPALIVRFVCEPNQRVKVEQEILNRFLEKQGALQARSGNQGFRLGKKRNQR